MSSLLSSSNNFCRLAFKRNSGFSTSNLAILSLRKSCSISFAFLTGCSFVNDAWSQPSAYFDITTNHWQDSQEMGASGIDLHQLCALHSSSDRWQCESAQHHISQKVLEFYLPVALFYLNQGSPCTLAISPDDPAHEMQWPANNSDPTSKTLSILYNGHTTQNALQSIKHASWMTPGAMTTIGREPSATGTDIMANKWRNWHSLTKFNWSTNWPKWMMQ